MIAALYFIYTAVAAGILICLWPLRADFDRRERIAVVSVALLWPFAGVLGLGLALWALSEDSEEP